jgi:radical SAM protein with 4Fe4S-binding SPASM domain
MPNLMLTSRCNFDCSYCFGKDFMKGTPKKDMTRETFLSLIDWILKPLPGKNTTRRTSLHLMGGEPTLHKDFVWMAKTVKSRIKDVKVFTNLATPHAPEYARELKDLEIRWIANVNPPETRTQEQDKNIKKSLGVLGDRVTLTFNMMPEPSPNDWVIDLICEYGLNRNVKVGFVLPTLSHTNEHLSDEDYPKVARRVVEFARACENFEITLDYECGIPWCAFTPNQLGELWRTNSKFFSTCNSILDITPDGRVIYCLPLATMSAVPYYEFETYPAAKDWYESLLNPYRPLGSTPRCHSCNLMRLNLCRGGCMARVLHGARSIAPVEKGEEIGRKHISVS